MSDKETVPELDYRWMTDKSYTPTLHDVYKILSRRIVGEDESRLALFTNWILARKYCVITGPSRGGKTYTIDSVKMLVLGDSDEGGLCYTMKQGSAKSGWYAAEELSKASYVIIPELNQLPLDMMEVLKTWGEDKTAEYSVVETFNGRKQNRKHILPYKPFVFAIADENNMVIPAELRYRLIEIRIDGSQEQTKKIIKSQAEKELDPFSHKKEIEIKIDDKMKNHIKTLPLADKLTYVNPLATFVAENVPKNFTDARTAHPLFQDAIKGLQRFYWKQSLLKQVNGKDVLFISPQVVMENYIVNGRNFLNSVMKCNDIELEILELLKSNLSRMSRKQIAQALRAKSINIRDSIINKHLLNLEEMNYVDVSSVGNSKFYEVSNEANMQGFHIKGNDLLEHCKVVMERLHPEHYDEYVETYLDRPTFIHPISGVVVDLRSYELGSAPKTISNKGLLEHKEAIQDEDNGITTDVIIEEPGFDDEEVELLEDMEEIDEDTDTLSDWLQSGKEMYTYDFIEKYGEEKLNKLLEEGEIFKPTEDTVRAIQ